LIAVSSFFRSLFSSAMTCGLPFTTNLQKRGDET
jgi:hypothetical protein